MMEMEHHDKNDRILTLSLVCLFIGSRYSILIGSRPSLWMVSFTPFSSPFSSISDRKSTMRSELIASTIPQCFALLKSQDIFFSRGSMVGILAAQQLLQPPPFSHHASSLHSGTEQMLSDTQILHDTALPALNSDIPLSSPSHPQPLTFQLAAFVMSHSERAFNRADHHSWNWWNWVQKDSLSLLHSSFWF